MRAALIALLLSAAPVAANDSVYAYDHVDPRGLGAHHVLPIPADVQFVPQPGRRFGILVSNRLSYRAALVQAAGPARAYCARTFRADLVRIDGIDRYSIPRLDAWGFAGRCD